LVTHTVAVHVELHSFPTRRSSDLRFHALLRFLDAFRDHSRLDGHAFGHTQAIHQLLHALAAKNARQIIFKRNEDDLARIFDGERSEEHTSELQSLRHLVWRPLLEK